MGANPQVQDLEAPTPTPQDTGPGLLEALARRWWLVMFGALVGLLLGYLYCTYIPPKYESKALLLVVKKRLDMVPGLEHSFAAVEEYMSTQAGIVQSPLVVERAVQDEKLASLKAFHESSDVTTSLIRGLTVKRDTKDRASNILELSFKGPEPEESRKVLGAVIKSYQKFLSETYQNVSENTLKLVNEARNTLKHDLARKEAEYREFRRNNHDLIMKDKGAGNVHNDMLLNLQSKLLALQVRRAETEGLLRKIEEGRRTDGKHGELMALIYQLPSRAIADSGGRSQSNTLEDKLLPGVIEERTLLAEYAPTHPLVAAARKKVELAYEVVTSILKLEHAGIRTAEQSLAELYRTQADKVQKSASAEFEDEVLRNDIARLQQLADLTLKRLQDMDVSKDLGGYAAQVIGPPTNGQLALVSQPFLIFPAAALVGLMGGAWLAVVSSATRRKPLLSGEAVRARLGWPVVGRIPVVRPDRKSAQKAGGSAPGASLCCVSRPDSPAADAYRGVRMALLATAGQEHKVLQITAPSKGEGTSTLAANLAVSFAEAGKATLLIDANLRRPSVETVFRLASRPGLAALLSAGGEAAQAIVPSGIPRLSILPCGPLPHNPAELLSSPRLQALLDSLGEQYDFVVIDTPPVLAVTDSALVASHVDGVLLALRSGKKAMDHAERAREVLDAVHASVLGVVVNGIRGRAGLNGG